MTRQAQEKRITDLRAQLDDMGLTAFVVPKADEFQSEYVHASSDRLCWLTGFSGSAGFAIVGRERAAIFTDGRYTEQAQRQADLPLWEHGHSADGPSRWLESWIQTGDRIGYDPRVHTAASLAWLREATQKLAADLTPVDQNPIDLIWQDRPSVPCGAIELYPESLAGESSANKRARMADALREEDLDAAVLSDPASIAWLLNIRGRDLDHTPFALGFGVLLSDGGVRIFMEPGKWSAEIREAVAAGAPGETRFESLEAFGAELATHSGKRVRIDASSASEWIGKQLEAGGATPDLGAEPCTLAKACKTPEELAGIRAAHVVDGVAMVRFLHWFSQNAPGGLNELEVAAQLESFRAKAEQYRSPSFRTISAFGPSGASPHYTVTAEIALPLAEGNLYLVDSGGQYQQGTTDITRVLSLGTPTEEMRQRYTEVLRGHIALGRAQFPEGITGSQLDPLARQFLWHSGVDFDHGTGHGVGCYLSVHEGPHRIAAQPNAVALRPGMVVSNEPGYYKPGHFGIRIENLVTVEVLDPQPVGAEATTLGFSTLTVCPYEPSLIVTEALRDDERKWLDDYHAWVCEVLTPLLAGEDAEWLADVTAPLR